MSALEIIRIVSFSVWLTVAIYRTPAVLRVLRGKARYYDALTSMIVGVGYLIAAFNIRWFIPDSAELHVGLHYLSILLALLLFRILWRYEGAVE